MMRFRYAGGAATVSDALCEALLDYATALAGAGQGGVADFPSCDDRGRLISVKVFLSASSQLWFSEIPPGEFAVDDSAAISHLQAKTASVVGRHTHNHPEPDEVGWDSEDFDLDYV
ncbi:MAG: hypothetical protein H7288_15450 [Kineosporiaceae bacterium]|nr:hypothetical protein [Aeromicrobium sp.]